MVVLLPTIALSGAKGTWLVTVWMDGLIGELLLPILLLFVFLFDSVLLAVGKFLPEMSRVVIDPSFLVEIDCGQVLVIGSWLVLRL